MNRRQPRSEIVLDRQYEGLTGSLRYSRSDVVDLLRARDADQDLQTRAELVISELASNAVQASPGSSYGVCVRIDDDSSIVIAVTSVSAGESVPSRESWGPATLLAPRGRGLLIVGKLSERVDVDQSVDGVITVMATLRRDRS